MGGKTKKEKSMRNLKFKELLKLVLVLVMLVQISSSCKPDEIVPDYAGKWMTVKPVAGSSGFVSVNYSLTLTDHTFIETFLTDIYRYTYPDPCKFVTIEGSISNSVNIMNFTPHKISYSNYNLATSTVSEPYETLTDKDQNFDVIFNNLAFPTSKYQVEYSIVDSQLILKVDYNEDGKYSENEKIVYTKQ